jgi:hypothetical protein
MSRYIYISEEYYGPEGVPLSTQSFLSLILFLLVDVKCFLLSDDDILKKDAAAAPLFNASTTPKGHPQEEAAVVKSSAVLPKKSTPAPASKRPKRAAAVTTSLEVHQPTAPSDNVSSSSCTRLFCFLIFSHIILFCRLMQKFLSLGAECVRIQETANASQGMSIVICGFLLLYPWSFIFP